MNHDAITAPPLVPAQPATWQAQPDTWHPGRGKVAGMTVACRKLVRDRIPEIIQAEGRRPVTRGLDEASYRQALLAKLTEEAQEASHATAAGLPGELADVLEVLRALTVTAGMSWPQLLALADDKRRQRGSFEQKIFLESVE